MSIPTYTGFSDVNGNLIYVGDILESEHGYTVTVCQDREDESFYGSLNCDINDSCRQIPYALNEGHGYRKVYGYRSSHEDNDE